MKKEADFLEWLSGARFYTGYCRYGQIGRYGHFVACNYDESEELGLLVDDLSGGDVEALDAPDKIFKICRWHQTDKNPALAMMLVICDMRDYYFNVLNNHPLVQ
jgi:hypothetical protein